MSAVWNPLSSFRLGMLKRNISNPAFDPSPVPSPNAPHRWELPMKLILIITVLATAVLPSAFGQNEPGRDVKLLNQSFGEAQVQRDIAKLDLLLADDFTLINPAGKILNKSQLLADMSAGDLRYESLNYDDIGLRVYRDIPLVTGRVVRK